MESREKFIILFFVFSVVVVVVVFNRGCLTWLAVYVKDPSKKEILIMQ